jgi:hypothetical protein
LKIGIAKRLQQAGIRGFETMKIWHPDENGQRLAVRTIIFEERSILSSRSLSQRSGLGVEILAVGDDTRKRLKQKGALPFGIT